jgi:small ligand-binding sensory domain FIST
MIRYAAALSQHPVPVEAVGACAADILEQLAGARPDLLVVFASEEHTGAFDEISTALRKLLAADTLIGCTASAIAGGGVEVENGPALSVWAGSWGAGHARTIRLRVETEDDGSRIVGWPDDMPTNGTLLLLADPFSFPVGDFLEVCNRGVSGLTVVGGLASAARGPGSNRLVVDGDAYRDGAVGVMLDLQVPVWTAVSQGCRPIGQPFTITKTDRNAVVELAGRPALERLQHIAASLPEEERELLGQGVHVGLVVDEHKSDFGRGDFLVRNLIAADTESGALTVGDNIDVGQTIQFHVRDAASADEDLRLVAGRALRRPKQQARAALMFTCNGRGAHLFGRPNHDADTLQELAGASLPLSGMFCSGEIGPVGGRSFLHGFTASLALFGG